jgi:hypothetical protein
MTIRFKADENDMLLYQLYTASKSQRISKKRRKSRRSVPLTYAVLAVIMAFLTGKFIFPVLLIVVAVGWYFIYPKWETGHYRRHYQGFIAERCRTIKYSGTEMQFDSEYIITKEEGTDGRILTSELESITEISQAVYLLFRNGSSLILPKNKIANVGELIPWLKQQAQSLKIAYTSEPGWEWK